MLNIQYYLFGGVRLRPRLSLELLLDLNRFLEFLESLSDSTLLAFRLSEFELPLLFPLLFLLFPYFTLSA